MRNLIFLIYNFLMLVEILILVEAILSWFPIGKNQVTEFIYQITEPFLKPGRYIQDKYLPNSYFDFSPIFAFAIIKILKTLLSMIL